MGGAAQEQLVAAGKTRVTRIPAWVCKERATPPDTAKASCPGDGFRQPAIAHRFNGGHEHERDTSSPDRDERIDSITTSVCWVNYLSSSLTDCRGRVPWSTPYPSRKSTATRLFLFMRCFLRSFPAWS